MSAADASTTNVSTDESHDGAHDSHGSTKASYDDVNVSFLFAAAVVSAVLTFVIIVCVQAFFLQYDRSEILRKDYDIINTPQTAIVDKQKDLLETSDFRAEKLVAAEEGAEAEIVNRFTIPLDEAIQMTLEQEQAARQ